MARIHVADNQYQLVEIGDPRPNDGHNQQDSPSGSDLPGFIVIDPEVTAVLTGTDSGFVEVEITTHEKAPPPLPGWEEVYEAERVSGTGEVCIWSVNGGTSEPPLPRFQVLPGSRYKVRVHVSGRSAAETIGVVSGDPIERHHIQLWPVA